MQLGNLSEDMMSCEECNRIQNEGEGEYFFRWKNAEILISGCEKHVKEVMNVLIEYIKNGGD